MDMKTVPVKVKGFGLLEILIGLVIVGIITSIAMPTYQQHILGSRRTQAINQLMQLHLSQQHYRLSHPHYAQQSAMGMPASEFYRFEISSAGVSAFELKASATGQQRLDKDCSVLSVDHNLERTPIDCWR